MRRMQTIGELFANLKSYFVDKTNTGTETMVGSLVASNVKANGRLYSANGAAFTAVQDLGTVASTDLLSSKLPAGFSGLVSFYVSDYYNRAVIALVKFDSTNALISWILFQNFTPNAAQSVVVGYGASYSSATYATLCAGTSVTKIFADFYDVTGVNANLGGTPKFAFENSTLHIRGTFTPTANIPAGTKLFSANQTLPARMTHGSAINSGAAGSETFVGISIQNNGDVYCLGALTAGVTYSIAVTATM